MLTESEARVIAAAEVARLRRDMGRWFADDVEFVIIGMEEYPVGWVYYYQSSKYLKSGRIRDSLAGNAPILVDRRDGTAVLTGTADDIEHYVREYEREHPLS
ncbi:YrhB domain-containing protein [Nonomuraea antri]|uniref:YrhB domain-containing protein n=1 Tax=Nonomuraea antri TaxID=2730852 RepID=UPI001C2C6CE6|nr:YrhB domain-containing protein [Nonomuraea antri]